MITWADSFVQEASKSLSGKPEQALLSRGVDISQQQEYKVGYVGKNLPDTVEYPEHFLKWWQGKQLSNVLVLPLTNTLGDNLGFQFRNVDQSIGGYNDYFVSKEETALFGLSQAMPHIWENKTIALVEGGFDLFPLQRHIPYVVSTIHAGISNSFLRVLKRLPLDKLWLMYDSDKVGKRVSYDIQKEYVDVFNVQIAVWPRIPYKDRFAKDPGELWETLGDERLGVLVLDIVGEPPQKREI